MGPILLPGVFSSAALLPLFQQVFNNCIMYSQICITKDMLQSINFKKCEYKQKTGVFNFIYAWSIFGTNWYFKRHELDSVGKV